MSAAGLAEAARRMHERGLDERAIAVFSDYYHQLELGAQGTIPEDSIEPLVDLTRLDGVGATEAERAQALGQVVVIKLNGGLGTSMGLAGAKSALSVRDGLTFLDVIARQVLALRAQYAAPLPVIFMNSFRTHEETEAILAAYPDLPVRGAAAGIPAKRRAEAAGR